MLESLGISASQARCYEQLIIDPRLSIETLTERLGDSPAHVQRDLDRLESLGLLSRSPDDPPRLIPAPPEVAIEALVHRQREHLERARLYANRLMDLYRDGRNAECAGDLVEYVEVIRGREAVVQRFQQLQEAAEKDLVVFVKPPYVTPTETQARMEHRLLEEGVRVRGLYERAGFETTGGYEYLSRFFDEGEEARVLPHVPMKLAIADRCLGLVPLAPDEPGGEAAALVHPSGLLDALNVLADTLWEQAVPINGAAGAQEALTGGVLPLTARDREVLQLLQAGLTDQAIARQLGLSERTVSRRVRRLMDKAGAETRFQLGWRAGVAGWLEASR